MPGGIAGGSGRGAEPEPDGATGTGGATMKDRPVTNIFFAGVGGQGIILASDIVAELAFRAGFDVKKNEIHGLSQRGGSVTSQVRYGGKVHTPIIMEGDAHFLVGLEILETLRWAHMVRPDGHIILNRQRILPAPVVLGDAEYPADAAETLSEYAPTLVVPAFETASEMGDARMANSVLLGALSAFLPDFSPDDWTAVLSEKLKPATLRANLDAFERGRGFAAEWAAGRAKAV
ncbi:MAG: indolepyruvate oxidoreductase subunit beta [Planctomycetota bacterium]|nr:indolepyruvate oxidoreductase subunit beta [Planctomycetota bacterium]